MLKVLVNGGVAVNVTTPEDLEHSFHPQIAALFIDAPDGVEVGWRLTDETWGPPE